MFKLSLKISGPSSVSLREISLEHDSFALGSGRTHGDGFIVLPSCGGIVSRVHCTIYKEGESWFLRDGNGKPSKNGVWLHYHGWLDGPVKLEPGQTFVLAESNDWEIKLMTSPIETTRPGQRLSEFSLDPDDSEVTEVEPVPPDLETTELLPPGTSPVVLDRIARLERNLLATQDKLNARACNIQRAFSLSCAAAAGMLFFAFSGAVLEKSEDREQFSDALIEALGGPGGLGTGAGAVLTTVLSIWISPGKDDD